MLTSAPQIIATTLQGGCEISLTDLIAVLGISGMLLERLQGIQKFLSEWSFRLIPPMTEGDLETPRVLQPSTKRTVAIQDVLNDIQKGESSEREYKSSLICDLRKETAAPGLDPKSYRSDHVLYAALKTVVAFANSGGGTLYVGIDDGGGLVGLHKDCRCLGLDDVSTDKWELELRNQIGGKALQGTELNNYLEVAFFSQNAVSFARISVLSRRKVTFLKGEAGWRVYCRQGNRSVEVGITEFEDFLLLRRNRGWG